jgi:hypothetical protein
MSVLSCVRACVHVWVRVGTRERVCVQHHNSIRFDGAWPTVFVKESCTVALVGCLLDEHAGEGVARRDAVAK